MIATFSTRSSALASPMRQYSRALWGRAATALA
jgi:hypothetical protein